MFLVHWGYALGCFAVVWLVWLYVGTANPAVKPGRTAEFKFLMWLKNLFLQMMGYVYNDIFTILYTLRHHNVICLNRKKVVEYEQFVVTPVHPGVDVRSAQLNEDNEDFASRRRYHQSATVHGHYVNMDD